MTNEDKASMVLGIFILLIILFSGVLIGRLISPTTEIERIEVEKLVSPCDKSFSDAERQMCIAGNICQGKLKDFKFNSLKVETIFNCGE